MEIDFEQAFKEANELKREYRDKYLQIETVCNELDDKITELEQQNDKLNEEIDELNATIDELTEQQEREIEEHLANQQEEFDLEIKQKDKEISNLEDAKYDLIADKESLEHEVKQLNNQIDIQRSVLSSIIIKNGAII